MKKLLLLFFLILPFLLSGLNTNYDINNSVGAWSLGTNDAVSTAIFDLSGEKNDGTSANTPVFTYDQNSVPNSALVLNGTSDKVTFGNVGNIKTFTIWIYPTAHTRSIADFDGGTISVEIDASSDITATGWTAPTIYVGGSVASAITLNAWNYITVTSATAVNASALVIGNEATWFAGNLSDHIVYSDEKSATVISSQYLAGQTTAGLVLDASSTAKQVSTLTENLAFDMPMVPKITRSSPTINSGSLTVGRKYVITAQDGEDFTADGSPNNNVGTIFVATGTNVTLDANDTVKEMDAVTLDLSANANHGTVSGATATYNGLVNAGAGIAYIPSEVAYGTHEFNWNKGADANTFLLRWRDSDDTTLYYLNITSNEAIRFYKFDGLVKLIDSGDAYVDYATWYRIKITRTSAGLFTIYLKGGAYGWDDWTTVGSATDNTHTTNNNFAIDLDNTDEISDLTINGKPISLSDAFQSTGTWTTTKPSYLWNGTTDYIDIGMDKPNDLTGDITFSCWIYPTGYGEGGFGRIIDNGKLIIFYRDIHKIQGMSDGSTTASSAVNSITDNIWQHLLITRNSAGDETNFYINGVLSGTVNQNSGTSTGGITNTFIGNNDATTRTFDGYIAHDRIWFSILSTTEITQEYNRKKSIYGN